MMCKNCVFHYQDEDDSFPCCHCCAPDGWAPCELEDYNEEYEED